MASWQCARWPNQVLSNYCSYCTVHCRSFSGYVKRSDEKMWDSLSVLLLSSHKESFSFMLSQWSQWCWSAHRLNCLTAAQLHNPVPLILFWHCAAIQSTDSFCQTLSQSTRFGPLNCAFSQIENMSVGGANKPKLAVTVCCHLVTSHHVDSHMYSFTTCRLVLWHVTMFCSGAWMRWDVINSPNLWLYYTIPFLGYMCLTVLIVLILISWSTI